MEQGKLLIVSAPSGSGKSTLVHYLMNTLEGLEFSVSATSREPRGEELNGIDYHFLTVEDFQKKIEADAFVEWEEVYPGRYYGTLKSEVERIRQKGNTVVFDVDVVGGLNIKKLYGNQALAVFIKPPSIDHLRQRLENRGTDSREDIESRLQKAEEEMMYADKFDGIILNDDLEIAKSEFIRLVENFVG